MQPPDHVDQEIEQYEIVLQEPDRLDEDKLREEDEEEDEYQPPEPDYEQTIEDRARDRGPDPEAVMWGGEDIPS